jgi:hypothetical protein
MRTRTVPALAWSLCAVSIALGVGALVLVVANGTSFAEFFTDTLPLGAELAITFPVVGAFIASRHPKNAVGWIFCVIGLTQGLVEFSYQYAIYGLVTEPGSLPSSGLMSWISSWAWVPGFGLLITLLLLLFPTGRLPSRRWRPVAWLSVAAMTVIVVGAVSLWRYRGERLLGDSADVEPSGFFAILFGMGFPLLLLCGLASIISLIVRFRRARGDERQQLKWFTFAATAVVLFAVVIEGILGEVVTGWEVVGNSLGVVLIPCVPLATGIAILKYRLYDIDRLINKTLVFGLLSGILVAGYVGGILLLQSVLPVPDDSPITVAASTLAMAALFRPLRTRVQSLVDRRFYRARYDATRTIDDFSARLRQQTDLDSLTDDLLGVIHQAVRPAYASVWLRDVQVLGP